MKKQDLMAMFSVDYDAKDVQYIKDIHMYLMKKNDIVCV